MRTPQLEITWHEKVTECDAVPLSLLLTFIFVIIAFRHVVKEWAVGVLKIEKRKDNVARPWHSLKRLPHPEQRQDAINRTTNGYPLGSITLRQRRSQEDQNV